MPNIQFALITAHDCDLAKSFQRDAEGKLNSTAIAHMTQGRADVIEIPDLSRLPVILEGLAPNQAITCGVPYAGDTELTTRAGVDFNPNAVARTNEAFRYPDGAALYAIDVDVEGDTYPSVDAVLNALETCSPWLEHCLRMARPSSSSYVAGRGLRGVHVYLVVSRGSDIPALAKRMQAEQWAAGRGHVKISKSGALLVRQLSDALVYQPSRLMFEAPPVLGEGVERDVPRDQICVLRAPAVRPGPQARARTADGFLDVQALPHVKEIEWRRFDTAKKQAKDAKRMDAKRTALNWHAQQAADAGLDTEAGNLLGVRALRVLDTKVLPPDWPLAIWTQDGRADVTVAAVLEAGEAAMGYTCADPFESLRANLSRSEMGKAEIVSMNGRPGVWTHKLQEFFAFGDTHMSVIETPLEVAAETLCGMIEDWPDARDKKRNSPDNVGYAMRILGDESGTAPRFNVCTGRVEAADAPDMFAYLRALSRLGCTNVSLTTVERGYEMLAQQHPVDPWRDAVLQLPQWDGVARLDTAFVDTFDTDDGVMVRHAARALFAGIVMRQMQPGAPAPVIPVLIGPQGVGKSLFVKQLARAINFPDPTQLFLTDDRRMSMAAARSPIAELCEMAGLARKEAEDVKRWLSDDIDVFRAPYERHESAHPRRFVLIGTANKNEVNQDDTGNRRMAPIEIRSMRAPGWHVEVPQILAEAKERFCQSMTDYEQMIREASDSVRDYNALAMLRGEGTPINDLDDLMPEILARGLQTVENNRVPFSFIRKALEAGPTGRKPNARQIARWLTMRGWVARNGNGGTRVYEAPQYFIDSAQSSNVESPNTNPFAAPTGEPNHAVH